MIRRHSEGRYFDLITQDDHARLSGLFARHVGNAAFGRPEPSESVLTAISMHDAGWPIHDERPTLNDQGLPRDVFESTRPIALPVWTASSERAAAADPYAGLLVSLHGMSLSVYATSRTSMEHEKFDVSQVKEKFAVNQFQHQEAERQEHLRQRLGLRTDIPLTYGLSPLGTSPEEDLLTCNFRLLQAMDMLSLSICCTEPPAPTTQDVHPHPGAKPLKLTLTRVRPDLLLVDPWPFDVPQIPFTIACRRLPATPHETESAFHTAYATAPSHELALTIASSGHA